MWQPPSAMTLPLKGKPGLRATRGRVSRIEKAPASNGAFPYAGTGRSHRENEEGDWQMRGALDENSALRPKVPRTPATSWIKQRRPKPPPRGADFAYMVDDEIVVTLPGTSYSVTYYKLPNSP